ncbi:unnamed protein product [Chrysoparadoxa australica]
MDEFGMGGATIYSTHGPTINPWSKDTAVIAGGSSGGSAAAVASYSSFAALGSDTGGSVRQPASYCGVVGLKPTYGRIPRHGLIAYASSLDTVGILSRSVLDSAMMLDATAGSDPSDSTCTSQPPPLSGWASNLLREGSSSLEGITIGVPAEFCVSELHSSVLRSWEASLGLAEKLGATIRQVELPSVKHALAAYLVLASAEASSNLARYDGVRYGSRAGWGAGRGLHQEYTATRTAGFGEEVKRRLLSGCFVLSSEAYHLHYEQALIVRANLSAELKQALTLVDALVVPTAPSMPPAVDQPYPEQASPVELFLDDVFTVPASLTGAPAISIPVDTVEEGRGELPVGMQIICAPLEEATAFRVAYALEQAIGFSI